MNNIQNAVKKIHELSSEFVMLNKFAREEYVEKYKEARIVDQPYGAYHSYDGFEVISENEIKVKFVYGIGDMEYCDSFIIKV